MNKAILLFALIGLIVLSGCTSKELLGCNGDFDCSDWKTCNSDFKCVLLENSCDSHNDCDEWEKCGEYHSCIVKKDRCSIDEHCQKITERSSLNRYGCNLDTHKCGLKTLTEGECLSDTDCEEGLHCKLTTIEEFKGRCLECAYEKDCSECFACIGEKCVEKPYCNTEPSPLEEALNNLNN